MQATISLGAAADRSKYWQTWQAENRRHIHPCLASVPRDQWHQIVPCLFHMDGAEFYRNNEFLVWSWCAATSEALNIWDFKFIYCMIPAMLCQLKPVLKSINEEIARLIGWDMTVCQSGRGAPRGFYGESFKAGSLRSEIADKCLRVRGAFAGLKSDGKARRDAHGFRRHYFFCCFPFSGALNIGYCFGVICYVILFDIKIGTTTASTSANHVSQLSLSEASPQMPPTTKISRLMRHGDRPASGMNPICSLTSIIFPHGWYMSQVQGWSCFSGISCMLYSLDSLEI